MNRIVTTGGFFFFLWGSSLSLQAQTWGIEYTGELQTGFNGKSCFANQLYLNAELEVNEHLKFCASTLSLARSRQDRVLNDLQVFSNLDADNIVLTPCIAGVEWSINDSHSLYVGIRDVSADYFTSPVTALFTNSSSGIFPTVSCIQQIANFPLAAVGLHYSYTHQHLDLQASLYNGIGHDQITGRENVWRVDPKCDGLFAMTQADYNLNESHYFLGGCLHTGTQVDREARSALWVYAEQALTPTLSLIADYSHAFGKGVECSDFAGAGVQYAERQSTVGLFCDYARFGQQEECAAELTFKYQVNPHLYAQTSYHLIHNDRWQSAALLRIGVEF